MDGRRNFMIGNGSTSYVQINGMGLTGSLKEWKRNLLVDSKLLGHFKSRVIGWACSWRWWSLDHHRTYVRMSSYREGPEGNAPLCVTSGCRRRGGLSPAPRTQDGYPMPPESAVVAESVETDTAGPMPGHWVTRWWLSPPSGVCPTKQLLFGTEVK